jgi:REP element-mobilizing transposase RayT
MTDTAVLLDHDHRRLVEKTIADHCRIRKWLLHAVTCRSNHVHVSVTAIGRDIEEPREQFKAWCTRKLNDMEKRFGRKPREDWWTERGWDVHVDEEAELCDVNAYIREGQDSTRFGDS